MNMEIDLSRRDFLKATAIVGGGLAIGVYLPAVAQEKLTPNPNAGKSFEPNAWIRITPDNAITIVVDKSEMGQGVMTSMPMLVAEELDVDWSQIKLQQAPANEVYKNRIFGIQATGGSTSVASSWQHLRQMGAAAREMLVAAAAQQWGVTPDSCVTDKGAIMHSASGRKLSYGEVATTAAGVPVPQNPKLKSPENFKIIGKPIPRVDTASKVNGTAGFGIDVKVPGMLIAAIAHSPVFGGKVGSFDTVQAKAIPGVRAVVLVGDGGVAVVANDYWTAKKGLQAVKIQWRDGANAQVSTAGINKVFAEAANRPGAVAHNHGDSAKALIQSAKKINAVYQLPYAAHATMEPMNCTAHVRKDACEIWAPTQNQTGVQMVAAMITGLPKENIIVHTTLLGGGFGRRFEQDFLADAVQISKTVDAPVKLIWSREEDMTHDFYRPAVYNRLSAGLDKNGMPVAWTHRIVCSSIMSRAIPQMVKNGIDPTSVEGAAELPYAIPNIHVDYVMKETGVPVGFWRSVGSSHTAFVVESFLDELAAAGKKDPYEFRRQLLEKSPREKAVLELAATKAGWGTPLPKGRARGIAVHKSFGSYVAEVAEVSVAKDGNVRVHKVTCAIDCGMFVNPNTVQAQMESCIVYGLTATLKGPITIDKGRVQQRNFDSYPMLRMNEMPVIEVHIMPSTEAPSGVGEPGVPPIAPAVANAVFAATGKRIRQLPIQAKQLMA
jgi:isoquinoline 1-oxidoreductase subunit beta